MSGTEATGRALSSRSLAPDAVDGRVGRQVIANLGALAGDQVDHPRRESSLVEGLRYRWS